MDILRIYLIWASDDSRFGPRIGPVVAEHFDNADERREFGGIRIPVYKRHAPFYPGSSAPRVIELDKAEHNLLVAIGTTELTNLFNDDNDWQRWLADLRQDLTTRGGQDHFVVLSLDPGALTLPGFEDLHAIRAYEWPLEIGKVSSETELLLRLTNLAGLVLEKSQGRKKRKQKLFISHAKIDGTDDATKIKERLDTTNFGIEPFVDAYDLTPGEAFTQELEDEIAESTVLLIQTDSYGSRPFCRWEVLKAKKHLRPIFVVHRVKIGEGRIFPYGGNVPLRIVLDIDRATIDSVLLDAMSLVLRGLIFSRRAEKAINEAGLANATALIRRPELVDLALLFDKGLTTLVYPDPALSDEEYDLFPSLGLAINLLPLSDLEARL